MKICDVCKQEKTLDELSRRYVSRCKSCDRQLSVARREHRETQRICRELENRVSELEERLESTEDELKRLRKFEKKARKREATHEERITAIEYMAEMFARNAKIGSAF